LGADRRRLASLIVVLAVGLGASPVLAKTHAKSHAASHAKSSAKAPAKRAAKTTAKAVAKAGPKTARVDEPSLKALSAGDVAAYKAAFQATRAGDFETAERLAKGIDNRLLMGRLTYAKLMHPEHTATYPELAAWLQDYRDQPEADRVYTLARKRRPENAPPPAAPEGDVAAATDSVAARAEAMAERFERPLPPPAAPTAKVDAKLQAAREAFYAGEVKKAFNLATAAGERWIAGMAAYRLDKHTEAQGWLSQLATDTSENEWVRSAAAYWAARAAIAGGEPQAAPAYLELAARTPYTFYGLIAERQLGLESSVTAPPPAPETAAASATRARSTGVAGADGAALARLVKADNRARRAAAFAQLGMRAEAGLELRAGLQGSAGEARKRWTSLALALNAPLTSPADLTSRSGRSRFDLAQYPTPELNPDGGFTVDKALVYALVRQESKFDPNAASAGGAYGLMQLMPETAARVAGDDKLKKDPSLLKEPGRNLQLGQGYVTKLLDATKGDILQAVAAYNVGPGVIAKTAAKLGSEIDSLLLIESMPGAQTREFVEKVMAGYWIYRGIFGQESPTLSAAASGAKAIAAALDRTGP
jgi:soluble lytic murein transglycosylase-like protein